jgi:Zn-dependent protease with chaperone function
MSGILYPGGPHGLWVFLLNTIVLGGAAAWTTGRAIAKAWQRPVFVPVAMLGGTFPALFALCRKLLLAALLCRRLCRTRCGGRSWLSAYARPSNGATIWVAPREREFFRLAREDADGHKPQLYGLMRMQSVVMDSFGSVILGADG